MRPEPLIKLAMGSLDEEIIVRRAEHRWQGVGIDEIPCSTAVRRPQTIGKPARAMFGKPFEKAAAARCEFDLLRAVFRNRRHAFGMRYQGTDHYSIRSFMRTEHSEGILRGAPPARPAPFPRRSANLGTRRTVCLRCVSARTIPFHPLPGGRTGTFQISCAYSLMVRSEENQPIRAVFRAAAFHHECLSRQRRNTER